MYRRNAFLLRASARDAALPLGDYVATLVARSASMGGQPPRAGTAGDLVASCAALAALGRDLRHLAQLLGQGQIRAAQEYRQRLDDIQVEVRRHLHVAAEVVADLDDLRKYRRSTSLDQG
jgi:hypothetical protein